MAEGSARVPSVSIRTLERSHVSVCLAYADHPLKGSSELVGGDVGVGFGSVC